MYSEILIYYNSWGEESVTDIQSGNIRDDAKHPIMFVLPPLITQAEMLISPMFETIDGEDIHLAHGRMSTT